MDREICKHVFRIQGAVRGPRACGVLGQNGRKGGRGGKLPEHLVQVPHHDGQHFCFDIEDSMF